MSSEDLNELLARLDDTLERRLPNVASRLRPGASVDELDSFEVEFGRALPAEFRALYRWHDGADFVGYHSLPGLGHWCPLFALFDRCLQWQEAWDIGFGPWWVPITLEDYGQSVVAIDASGAHDEPAPVIFYDSADGVQRAADSVVELIMRMVDAVESGAFAEDADGICATVDGLDPIASLLPVRTLPSGSLEPDAVAPERFRIPRRFDTSADTFEGAEADPTEHLRHAVAVMRDLLHRGASTRNAAAVRPTISSNLDSLDVDNMEPHVMRQTAASLRLDLDLLWRALDAPLGAGDWHHEWESAEADLLAVASFDR